MELVPCVICSKQSKYYCTCKTPHINFCGIHLADHEYSPGHHRISLLYPNTLPVNASTKLQLLDKLNEVSSSSKLQITKLLYSCSEAILTIEAHTAHAIENLQKFILLCNRIADSIQSMETIERKLMYSPLESALLSNDSSNFIENITGPVISYSETNLPQYSPSLFPHFFYNYTDLSLGHSKVNTINIYPDNATISVGPKTAFRCLNIGNRKILITGGEIQEKLPGNVACIVEINTWNATELAPMKNSRMFHSMTWINGFPAVIGGHDGNGTINSVEIYKNTGWEENSQINIARHSFTSICSDRVVWIIGGLDQSYLDSLERYKKGAWQVVGIKLPRPLAAVGLCFLEDYLVLFGGITEGNKVTNNTHLFDTQTRFIKEVQNLVVSTSFAFSSVFVGERKIHALGKVNNETVASMIEIDKILIQ